MSGHKFSGIGKPDFVKRRPLEVGDCELEHSERLLKVEIVPQELGVLEHHEGSETAVLLAAVEGSLHLAEIAQVYL